MTERVECVVIGAGVIGLAVARRLARAGVEVIVLERAEMIGTETSSRNSEIVHAGIYYPTGSLKARTCVAGKHALYDYCAAHGIAHRRCGKIIVATDDSQVDELAALKERAAANGVGDLSWLTPDEVARMEPEVHCVAALHSPSTGIVDSHGLMLSFQGEAEERGAMIAYHAPVTGGRVEDDGIVVDVGGETPTALKADRLINAAGIWAPAVARTVEGLDRKTVPRDYLCKGNYYTLAGKSPFTRPVYPVPEKAGLGVHVTVDLAGQVRFGPDVEWVESIDYDVDPGRADAFYAAIRRYWPGLPDGAIQAGYSGIRPKLQAPGEPAADFMVQGPSAHGIDGLVNLYGIESPGLTSSLALADLVAEMLSVGS